jgi:hypothetical protein
MILPPFEGSKRKIARANRHISELESLLADFASKVVLKLGADIHDAIRSTRPYTKNGHLGLRGLHDLDILDKHEITLPTYLVARGKIPMVDQVMKMIGFNFQGFYPVHEGSKLSIRKDLGEPSEVLDFSGAKPTPQLPPGLPFAEKPIVEVLKGLSHLTAQIVTGFERKFGGRNPVTPSPPGSGDGGIKSG